MKAATVLVRRRPEPGAEELVRLQDEKGQVYGHTGTLAAMSKVEQAAKLRDTLLRHEVDILTDDSVAAYMKEWEESGRSAQEEFQQEIRRHETGIAAGQRVLTLNGPTTDIGLSIVVGVAGGLAALALLLVLSYPFEGLPSFHWPVGIGLCVIAGIAMGRFQRRLVRWAAEYVDVRPIVKAKLEADHDKVQVFSWRTSALPSYQGEVPPEILHKAERLKQDLPEAQFIVHYLVSGKPKVRYDGAVWEWKFPEPAANSSEREAAWQRPKAF